MIGLKKVNVLLGFIVILGSFVSCWVFIFIHDGDPPMKEWFYGMIGFILGLFVKSPKWKNKNNGNGNNEDNNNGNNEDDNGNDIV